MEFLIVTGLSGAGKSLVVGALEDIGFYCADNMPTTFITRFYDLCAQAELQKVALVTDVRTIDKFTTLLADLQQMRDEGKQFKILFMQCGDNVLINRFKETRRKHPLSDKYNSVYDAIAAERKLLEPVADIADYIIDTTLITPAQLKDRVCKMFGQDKANGMVVQIVAFGFKNGAFTEADLLFDVRCFRNPHYIPELRPLTGHDAPVHEYVMDSPDVPEFLEKLYDMVDFLLPLYMTEGKSELVIGIGCTGGQHRSITIAEELFHHIKGDYHAVQVDRDVK